MKQNSTKQLLQRMGKIILTTAVMLIAALPASASHYRYGSITWQKVTGFTNRVEFTITQSWRGNAFGSLPSVGQTVNTFETFNFGDGTSTTISIKVTSVNATDNWFFGEMKVTKTYSTNGTYTAFYSSCCRIGSPLQNGSNGNFRCETTVNIGTTNNSPVSTMPPIINLQTGLSAASFTIPASDPDGDALRFRTATSSEISITPASQFSVDTLGNATFNTTGLSIGNLYAMAVAVTDGKSKIIVDFMVKIVAQSNPPAFDYSVTPSNNASFQVSPGQTVSFNVKATDPDPGSTVSLFAVGVPSGATFSPGSASNPITTAFSWTPTTGQLGQRIVTFTAQDNNGVQKQTSVSILVSMKPEFIAPTPTTDIVVTPGDTVIFTVKAQDPDTGDRVTINKMEGADNNGAAVAMTNSLYNGFSLSPFPTATANPTSGDAFWITSGSQWGERPITFTAEDKYGDKTTATVHVLINTRPTIQTTAPDEVIAGSSYVYNFVGTDPDTAYGDELEIHGVGLPTWLSLVDNGDGTATLSGNPTIADSGVYNFQIKLEDIHHHSNIGGIPTENVTLTVIPCSVTAKTKNITVNLDANGEASISPSDVNNNSVATCGIASLALSVSDFDCNDIGNNTVTLTVTDVYGKTDTEDATVTIADNTAPVAKCKDITLSLTGGSATLTGSMIDDGSSDNCGIASLAVSKSSWGCSDVGTTEVTLTAKDASGNSHTCAADVTVDVIYAADAGSNKVVYYGAPSAYSCAGLTASGSGGSGYSYSWNTGSSSQTITVCPSATTTYSVAITDNQGCTAKDSVKVCSFDVRCGKKLDKVLVCHNTGSKSNPTNEICIDASALSSHLGGHGDHLGNCGASYTCGGSEPFSGQTPVNGYALGETANLEAFPNPVQNTAHIFFSVPMEQEVDVQLYNAAGQLVKTIHHGAVPANLTMSVDLNMNGMPAGLYIVRMNTANAESREIKLVKQP